MDFEALQHKWQKLGKDAKSPLPDQAGDDLMKPIEALQRTTVFGSLLLSVVFAGMFVGMGFLYKKLGGESWAFDLGLGLVFLDLLVALGFSWSTVISWRNKNFNLANQDFVGKVIRSLRRRKLLMRVVIPIYSLVLVTGIHLVYLHSLHMLPLNKRILIHVVMTLFVLAIYLLSRYIHIQKKKKTEYPLLARLEAWQRNLEEESV